MELKVFLVEDVQRMRGLIQDLFDSIGGFRITGAVSSEAEAKLWLEDHPGEWDVVILDLVLDQGSGLGVIRKAKELHPASQVVVFSSYVSDVIREHCLRLGADAVFGKGETSAFITWLHQLSGGGAATP